MSSSGFNPQQVQMKEEANRQEYIQRREQERKFFELSEQAMMYRRAVAKKMGGAVDRWDDEEFDARKETQEQREQRQFAGLTNKDAESNRVYAGVHTRAGATKGVVLTSDGSLAPQGNNWVHEFDSNGYREMLLFAKQQLGMDTAPTFDFGNPNIGGSIRFMGMELNSTRKLAIEQMFGILRLAQEEGMALEGFGPNAQRMIDEIAHDNVLNDAFKDDLNKKELERYYQNAFPDDTPEDQKHFNCRRYFEWRLDYLVENKDYQNIKMGLRDEKLKSFKDEIEQPLDIEHYLEKVNKDAEDNAIPEDDWEKRAEAVEKAIQKIEERVAKNDEVIDSVNHQIETERKLIENSKVTEVLDTIQNASAKGSKPRNDRDVAVSKVERRNENDLECIKKLREQLTDDIAKIKAAAADANNLTAGEKAKIEKNEKLLKSLDKDSGLESKIEGQKKNLDEGAKKWEKSDGSPGVREETVKAQKEKIAEKQNKQDKTTTVKIK